MDILKTAAQITTKSKIINQLLRLRTSSPICIKPNVSCRFLSNDKKTTMDLQDFSKMYLQNVRIPIDNKQQSIEVQKVFLQCGYEWFNGHNKIIDSGGIDNICSYPNKKIRQSGFFGLETEKKFVSFDEFINSWEAVSKNVVICQNCKNFWITPIEKCNCNSTSFQKTHSDNLMLSKNVGCL